MQPGMSMLIENGTVLTGGKTPAVLPNHSVLVEDGVITRIAPRRRIRSFTGKRIDASGKVVMPGLINAHTHFYSTFARGLTRTRPARDFVGVLKNLWWRLDSALTTEDCYYSALIALLDAIRHGTTTLIDHHASPGAVRGSLQAIEMAVRQTGLRACLCYELSDRDGARVARQGLEENVSFIRRCRRGSRAKVGRAVPSAPWHIPETSSLGTSSRARGALGTARPTTGMSHPQPSTFDPQPTVSALFGLHAAFTLKDSTLEEAATLGRMLGTGFHVHVAEAQSDQDYSLRHHRKRVVERLSQFGILGPQSIAAHCVHVNRREMDLLAETGTAVVHNPQSNLNNAVGIADVLALVHRGVLVGLGTDAMTTNMLEELRVALWAQHIRAQDPSVGFSEVVTALFGNNPQIATRALGLPLGELRVGRVGDVVIVDYDPPTPLEAGNAFGHLVFGISQAAVDTTIVGGRVLMENKRLTLDLDEARINARSRELAKRLWKRL
jgi:cytosine/adenosine deaminase-related metal-dependent hydrolase